MKTKLMAFAATGILALGLASPSPSLARDDSGDEALLLGAILGVATIAAVIDSQDDGYRHKAHYGGKYRGDHYRGDRYRGHRDRDRHRYGHQDRYGPNCHDAFRKGYRHGYKKGKYRGHRFGYRCRGAYEAGFRRGIHKGGHYYGGPHRGKHGYDNDHGRRHGGYYR